MLGSMPDYLKKYFFFTLAIGGIGFLDGLLNLAGVSVPIIFDVIAFISFVVNILALIYFWYRRKARITFVLPIYHLLFFVLATLSSVWLAVQGEMTTAILQGYNLVSLVGSLFEIIFSLYLLQKFELMQLPWLAKMHIQR